MYTLETKEGYRFLAKYIDTLRGGCYIDEEGYEIDTSNVVYIGKV